MKILLLGRNGQLGWELQRSLALLGEVVALGRDSATNPQGLCGDLEQLEALGQSVAQLRPDVIVNAAAHTAVDRAESEPELALTLNALAPGVLADAANAVGSLLVHFSTDYVFDGSGDTPWVETDATAPLNTYGRTKLAGELAVARCARHLIFRTSWVYAARGGNFAKTMLRLARSRDTLQVINDQLGAPTGAELLADATAHAVRSALRRSAVGQAASGSDVFGTYHLAASGVTTWFDYASFVIGQARAAHPQANWAVRDIVPVPTSAFPTPARRPNNSRLNTQKFQTTFQLRLPDWQDGVTRMLTEIDHGNSL